MAYRRCPYCRAYLDPGEICDCCYEAVEINGQKQE